MILVAARDAPSAHAEGAPGEQLVSGDKPWQRGVDAGQRAAAEAEFLSGNALFERSEYAAAAEKYRAALRSWAHPAIQFNLAVCLIHLDRPVEAYDTVQAALRHGREALPEHFDEANTYERLLRDRISTLEVTLPAERKGTTVTLDGESLVADAGEAKVTRRLAPGRHALVARRAHFETWSKDLVLLPGEVTREVIVLRAPRTRTVRRWSASTPWWVAGAGGAAAVVGTASLLLGNANVRAVNAEVTRQCPPPSGCSEGLPSELASDRARAQLEQRMGVTALMAGAATLATGVVLLVLNQPRQVLDTPGVALRVTPEEIGIGWSRAF
jgi:tetratricopeptide (TPR) repeat protein